MFLYGFFFLSLIACYLLLPGLKVRNSNKHFSSCDSFRTISGAHMEKRTLLKSPHIYKKHRVQYEART